MTTTLTVTDMACDGCEANVEDALKAVPGVDRARADHETGCVTVDGEADVDALVAAVVEAGYEATS